jgi:hypothetical protein
MCAVTDLLQLMFIIQGLFVMDMPSKSALLHRKPTSIGTSRDSCGAQDSYEYKGNALYKVSRFVSWYNILIGAEFPTEWYSSNCLGL